jgi:hypothetical protein
MQSWTKGFDTALRALHRVVIYFVTVPKDDHTRGASVEHKCSFDSSEGDL